jgi:hypothetical protein
MCPRLLVRTEMCTTACAANGGLSPGQRVQRMLQQARYQHHQQLLLPRCIGFGRRLCVAVLVLRAG